MHGEELMKKALLEGLPIKLKVYDLSERTVRCREYGWSIKVRPVKRKSKRRAGRLLAKWTTKKQKK